MASVAISDRGLFPSLWPSCASSSPGEEEFFRSVMAAGALHRAGPNDGPAKRGYRRGTHPLSPEWRGSYSEMAATLRPVEDTLAPLVPVARQAELLAERGRRPASQLARIL